MTDIEIGGSDIFSDGMVRLYRQRTDLPFTHENAICFKAEISSPMRIRQAVTKLLREESKAADEHPFAWNPRFGYVTASPYMCGTGLEISAMFHLEGLHLIGDLPMALNALNGMRMNAYGCDGDGLKDVAHIFRIVNAQALGLEELELAARIRQIFSDIVKQESNARIRLVEEFPRVFEDAIERSLAVLRSCRLLSNLELVDIISPLKLAASINFLDNFTREEASEIMMSRIGQPPPSVPNTYEEQKELDRKDAALADKANRRFRNVRLNDFAKGYL